MALPRLVRRSIVRASIVTARFTTRDGRDGAHLIARDPLSELTKESFEFHRGIESPLVFFRREWKAIAFFGGAFCIVMAAVVLWVDPAFFYPRIQTDPLFYFLKAKSLVETGSTSARAAVNLPPFAYAAMPGVLRAPFILVFRDFDDQWRGMQLFNIPILASVAVMSAYIVSWTLPKRVHWMAIAFAFAFTVLSPVWIANVFSPLADAPYAAFSLFAAILSARILCDHRPLSSRRGLIALYCVLFVVVFLLRFTGPVLLVFAAVLAKGRWQGREMSPAAKKGLIITPIVAIALLVLFNFQAIFGRYLREPWSFVMRGDKVGMFLNLFGLAIPDQILPDFHLGFSQPPIIDLFFAEFAHTTRDALWTGFGFVISAVVVLGMWRSRSRFLPEILYFLAPLTVLALMMPSTSRYLMSYQPFLWLFFIEGARTLFRRFVPAGSVTVRTRVIASIAAVAIIAGVGGLRWYRVAGTGADRSLAVSMKQAPEYVSEVSRTFRSMRQFVETLPRDRTLLIGARGDVGRWTAISGRLYYQPDSALVAVAGKKDVYLIVECGTLEFCQSFPEWKNRALDRLCMFGEFSYDSVFAVRSKWARAEVFRVKPAT